MWFDYFGSGKMAGTTRCRGCVSGPARCVAKCARAQEAVPCEAERAKMTHAVVASRGRLEVGVIILMIHGNVTSIMWSAAGIICCGFRSRMSIHHELSGWMYGAENPFAFGAPARAWRNAQGRGPFNSDATARLRHRNM